MEVGRKPGDLDAPGKVVLVVEGRSLPWWIRLRLQRVGSVLSCSAALSAPLATGKRRAGLGCEGREVGRNCRQVLGLLPVKGEQWGRSEQSMWRSEEEPGASNPLLLFSA